MYLKFDFHDSDGEIKKIHYEKFLPFAASELYKRKVNTFNILSEGPNVKTICELVLDIENIDFDFKPGDAIGILPENNHLEVDAIISRLGWQHFAEKSYTLSISENTTKKKRTIPKHLPQTRTISTLLRKYVDIRSIPKKLFLKGLLNYTTNKDDQQKLEQLSDSKSYEHFINGEGRTLLKLLTNLPSCQVSPEYLFENLPPLQPRYYSIASSPKIKNELKIIFSITVNPDGSKGVCTGYLETAKELEFYFRKSSEFLKFEDDFGAVILVGIGSGVAPFLAYLQDINLKDDDNDYIDLKEIDINPINIDSLLKIKSLNINPTQKILKTGLYFGCRYPTEDFIYKDQLNLYLENGVLNWLNTAFSRLENLHVQDKIANDGLKIVDCLLKNNAVVCICGDSKSLGETVGSVIIDQLVVFGGKSLEEAKEYLEKMRNEKRFQLDIWL